MSETEVLVIGAGPVGLTLAIDLGQRGIRCTLVESKDAPQFLPKMERANARSMEMYRRIGLADGIRQAGLRGDCPMDVYVVTDLNTSPLLRLAYPSVNEARAECRATNDGSGSLVPYQLISQYSLEPFLKSVAEKLPTVKVRYGCELIDFSQDGEGVQAVIQRGTTTETLQARYMVGCDGGEFRTAPARHQAAWRRRTDGIAPSLVPLR